MTDEDLDDLRADIEALRKHAAIGRYNTVQLFEQTAWNGVVDAVLAMLHYRRRKGREDMTDPKANEPHQPKTVTTPNADLIRAAVRWWVGKRPVGWTLEAHQMNPIVNCQTRNDQQLAEAIAKWTVTYFLVKPSVPPNRKIREGEPICKTCGGGKAQHDRNELDHSFVKG